MLKKIINFLDGKKTYVGGAVVFIAGGLHALKVIDQPTFEALVAVGGAIAAFGVRHAIAKLGK